MTDPTPIPATLCDAFQRTAAVAPDTVALRAVGATRTVTWRALAEDVRLLAAGLAGLGVRRGDTVALMMTNRIEFFPVDLATQHLGAIPFSVYNTLPAAQLAHVLRNSGSRVLVCETQYLPVVRESGVAVEHLILVDADEARPTEGTLSLETLRARGRAHTSFDFDAAWRSVQPDDVLTLIYTSGTTGPSKGVEITHANLLAQAAGLAQVLDFRFGDRTTSYLPSAHIVDRFTCLYAQAIYGVQVTVVPDIKEIAKALPDCRPTIWCAVPRVWNKIKQALELGIESEPDEARQRAVREALETGLRRTRLLQAGKPVDDELAAAHAKADAGVLSALRSRLGMDEVRWAVTGAAPTPPATLEFFAALGVPICEGWGMSELSCFGAVSPPAQARFGTLGKLLPGLEARQAADGELLVRGPAVTKGYRNDPDRTREAFDQDGWFHTGDVIVSDADDYLTIVDRKKDLIINEGGKNISPVTVETALTTASPLIGTAVTIGDSRPYITALLVLDAEAAAAFADEHGLQPDPRSLARSPLLIDALKAAVAEGNSRLARVEQVKRFRVIPAYWDATSDELTATLKLKRQKVAEKYGADIAALYADPISSDIHEPADR
ncbi:AMP-binding protein [Streptomyces viridochromogenes]|uniref:Putative Fatty-acid-CoA ligase n=1 Tax=Streptomyces viridochromogenes Tue57 TaxID=1160705 RepID=L8P4N3_STRVR|nr:AMP-binding protein [Streptomyces viridochromogenes]ELS51078.1 putative Fatty-acid-CoA ligase [Streptomyces viridochromogenes Tue57]